MLNRQTTIHIQTLDRISHNAYRFQSSGNFTWKKITKFSKPFAFGGFRGPVQHINFTISKWVWKLTKIQSGDRRMNKDTYMQKWRRLKFLQGISYSSLKKYITIIRRSALDVNSFYAFNNWKRLFCCFYRHLCLDNFP